MQTNDDLANWSPLLPRLHKMRSQISLLLVTIFFYSTFDGTDGQCAVPTLTPPLQWVGGNPPSTDPIPDGDSADANIECADGHTLVGTATLRCTGMTLSDLPMCKEDCDDPGDAPPNGQKEGDTYTHGSTVTYTCDDGYTLNGQSVLTCTDGEWDHSVPNCTEETATTEAATTEDDSENGVGLSTFGYLMIPAVIFALFSN